MSRAEQRGKRPGMAARAAIRCSVVLAGLVLATQARAECQREMLRDLSARYVEAQ